MSAKKSTSKHTISIKKSKKGTFTAAAKRSGMTVQGKASAVLANPKASPAMKKKANFARNAAKFNHSSRSSSSSSSASTKSGSGRKK